jgi:hypothetical protein
MYQFEVINEKPIIDDEPVKIKKKSPFDYSNSIDSKINLRAELESYSQFMVNRIYSQYKEYVFFVNEINKYNISNEFHYDTYYHFVTKKKRFAKWGKSELDEKSISMLIEYYNINRRKAIELLDLVDLKMIESALYHGGLKNESRRY